MKGFSEMPEVIVHGGVHKTATSHIQSILQRNAGHMRKHGVHYLHHRTTRKEFTYPCQLHGYGELGMKYKRKYSAGELRQVTRTFFRDISAKPGERIILSDENMPGHCGQCINNGKLYNHRSTLLPIFAREIAFPVREVHVALRNYADFFASAYVEYLRSAKPLRAISTEAHMKREVLSKLPSWFDYITELRAAFPNSKIVVWRHEDFRPLEPRIIQNLIGANINIDDLKHPKRTRGRPSASQIAIRELQLAIHRDGAKSGLARRADIQDTYPRGSIYPGYAPWSATQRAHLMRLYDLDIEKIKKLDYMSFLSPD